MKDKQYVQKKKPLQIQTAFWEVLDNKWNIFFLKNPFTESFWKTIIQMW